MKKFEMTIKYAIYPCSNQCINFKHIVFSVPFFSFVFFLVFFPSSFLFSFIDMLGISAGADHGKTKERDTSPSCQDRTKEGAIPKRKTRTSNSTNQSESINKTQEVHLFIDQTSLRS